MKSEINAVQKALASLASDREKGELTTWLRCIDEAAQRVVAEHFQEADEARFLRTGGKRHYRVKGVDSRVALAGAAAVWFLVDEHENPAVVWWAFVNHGVELSRLEGGAVALLKRKNELLDVMRGIHSLMPEIRELATELQLGSDGGAA